MSNIVEQFTYGRKTNSLYPTFDDSEEDLSDDDNFFEPKKSKEQKKPKKGEKLKHSSSRLTKSETERAKKRKTELDSILEDSQDEILDPELEAQISESLKKNNSFKLLGQTIQRSQWHSLELQRLRHGIEEDDNELKRTATEPLESKSIQVTFKYGNIIKPIKTGKGFKMGDLLEVFIKTEHITKSEADQLEMYLDKMLVDRDKDPEQLNLRESDCVILKSAQDFFNDDLKEDSKDGTIILTLQGNTLERKKYRIKIEEPLEKLHKRYCQDLRLDPAATILTFDGTELDLSLSPCELEEPLEDEDVIDVETS